jgi:hypothetical protein
MAAGPIINIPIIMQLNNVLNNYDKFNDPDDGFQQFMELCIQYKNINISEFSELCHTNEQFRAKVIEKKLHCTVDGILYDECGDLLSSDYPNKIYHIEETEGGYEHDIVIIWRGAFTCKSDVIIESIVMTA